jgi:hypothetical protein
MPHGIDLASSLLEEIEKEERAAVAARLKTLGRRAAMKNLVTWISWIYLLTNTVRILFYAPQILSVFRANDGARSVAITTWGFWTFANLTALLYGWMVIRDPGFTLIFLGNFICTGAVTAIAAHKRLRLRRSGPLAPG